MKNKIISLVLATAVLVQPVSVLAANESLFPPDETITNTSINENGYLVAPTNIGSDQYVDTRLKRYIMDRGPQYQCYVTYYYEDYWTCLSNTMQLLLDEDHTMTFPLPERPCLPYEGYSAEELLKVDYEDSLVCQGQLDIVEDCTDFVVTINNDDTYTVSLVVADLPIFDTEDDAFAAGFGDTVFQHYLVRESVVTNPGVTTDVSLGNLKLIIEAAEEEIADANLNDDMTNEEKTTALFWSMINKGYRYHIDDNNFNNIEYNAAGVALNHYGACGGLNEFFAFTCQLAGIPVFAVDVMQPTFAASMDSNSQHLTTVLWTPEGMVPYDFSDGCSLAGYYYDGISYNSMYTDEYIANIAIGDNYDWHDFNGVVYPAKDEEHAIMFSYEF